MKYYSDKTKKLYDKVEDLQTAETSYDKARAEEDVKQRDRKRRADEVKNARKELVNAHKNYNDKLTKFIKDYGSYHETYTDNDSDSISTSDIILKLFGFQNKPSRLFFLWRLTQAGEEDRLLSDQAGEIPCEGSNPSGSANTKFMVMYLI